MNQTINTLFLGNGLNLLEGAKDWNTLLTSIAIVAGGRRIIDDVPNTLQYESIMLHTEYSSYATLEDANGRMFVDSDGKIFKTKENTEEFIKREISRAIESIHASEYHKHFINLPFDHIITTNYDDAISEALTSEGYRQTWKNFSESLYSIRRRVGYQGKEKSKVVYYIHGDMHHPKSIMLGLDHYCGSIGKINDYLKGHYDYSGTILLDLPKRLSQGINDIMSWIDLFFMSNIYIVGFGLDYSETDLWWILNKRKRYLRERGGLINNKIVYLGETTPSKKELLESLGVNVISFASNGNYTQMYDEILRKIDKII